MYSAIGHFTTKTKYFDDKERKKKRENLTKKKREKKINFLREFCMCRSVYLVLF